MSFDRETQKSTHVGGDVGIEEKGSYTFAATEVDGASLTLPTKLKRVNGGMGVTEDGLTCYPALGEVSAGVVVFTRCGTWSDETPTLHYSLFGY